MHAGQGIELRDQACAEGSLTVAVDRDAPPHSCLANWGDHVCTQQGQLAQHQLLQHCLGEEPADTRYAAHLVARELRHPQSEGQHVDKQGTAEVGAAGDTGLAS